MTIEKASPLTRDGEYYIARCRRTESLQAFAINLFAAVVTLDVTVRASPIDGP